MLCRFGYFKMLFLLVFCCLSSSSSSSRFSTCTSSSSFDCGVQIGRGQRTRIREALKTQHGSSLIAFVATTPGAALYQDYLSLHEQVYPHLVDEVRGLANGAGVEFQHLMALNLEFELMSKGNVSNEGYVKGCSDFHLVKGANIRGWGHNEDGNARDNDLFYFVSANISANISNMSSSSTTTTSSSLSSSYFSFTYAGRLSGWAWSYNTFGLVFTVNGLFVLPDTKLGLGINFVARDLLDSTSVDNLIVRAQRSGQDGGSHFNVGNIFQDGIDNQLQLSIETGFAGTTIQEIDGTSMDGIADWYAHFNAYLHVDTYPQAGDYTSSVFRMARATTLSQKMKKKKKKKEQDVDLNWILDILSDQGGGAEKDTYCLYRCNTQEDPYETYVTVLIDLVATTLTVYTNRTNSWQAENYWLQIDLSKKLLPTSIPDFPREYA